MPEEPERDTLPNTNVHSRRSQVFIGSKLQFEDSDEDDVVFICKTVSRNSLHKQISELKQPKDEYRNGNSCSETLKKNIAELKKPNRTCSTLPKTEKTADLESVNLDCMYEKPCVDTLQKSAAELKRPSEENAYEKKSLDAFANETTELIKDSDFDKTSSHTFHKNPPQRERSSEECTYSKSTLNKSHEKTADQERSNKQSAYEKLTTESILPKTAVGKKTNDECAFVILSTDPFPKKTTEMKTNNSDCVSEIPTMDKLTKNTVEKKRQNEEYVYAKSSTNTEQKNFANPIRSNEDCVYDETSTTDIVYPKNPAEMEGQKEECVYGKSNTNTGCKTICDILVTGMLRHEGTDLKNSNEVCVSEITSMNVLPKKTSHVKRSDEKSMYEKPCPKSRKVNVQIIGEKRKKVQDNENYTSEISEEVRNQELLLDSLNYNKITSYIIIDDDNDTLQESGSDIQTNNSKICAKTEVNIPVSSIAEIPEVHELVVKTECNTLLTNSDIKQPPEKSVIHRVCTKTNKSDENKICKNIRDSDNVECVTNRKTTPQSKYENYDKQQPQDIKAEIESVKLEDRFPATKADINCLDRAKLGVSGECKNNIVEPTNNAEIKNSVIISHINPCTDTRSVIVETDKDGPICSKPIDAVKWFCESVNPPGFDTSLRHLSELIICVMKEKEDYKKKILEAERFSNPGVIHGIKVTARQQLLQNESHIMKGVISYFKLDFINQFTSPSFVEILFNISQKVAAETKVLETFDRNVYMQVLKEIYSQTHAYYDKIGIVGKAFNSSTSHQFPSSTVEASPVVTPVSILKQYLCHGPIRNPLPIPDRHSGVPNFASVQRRPRTRTLSSSSTNYAPQPTILPYKLSTQQRIKIRKIVNSPRNTVQCPNYRNAKEFSAGNTMKTANVIEASTQQTVTHFPFLTTQLQHSNSNQGSEFGNVVQKAVPQYQNISSFNANTRCQQNPTNRNDVDAGYKLHTMNQNIARYRLPHKQQSTIHTVNVQPTCQDANQSAVPQLNNNTATNNQHQNNSLLYGCLMEKCYNGSELSEGVNNGQILWNKQLNPIEPNSFQCTTFINSHTQAFAGASDTVATIATSVVAPGPPTANTVIPVHIPAPTAATPAIPGSVAPPTTPAAYHTTQPTAPTAVPVLPEELRSISRDSGFMSPTVTTLSSNTDIGCPPVGRCKVCNQTTYLRCVRCFSVFYCNTPCQTADWPYHQRICREDAS